ncbi:hypothetical protein Tco_0059386 [Tanacetum coccineum]
MDDLNITMEEYIRLEEEKAQKRGKVFNWETAKYGKIWYDEDIHDLRSVETEFPATAFNDEVSSEKTLSCEPTVSSLNDEIDFRISFDDSDDEDYTVIFDKNSFSYKIISSNNLKTDSKNDNEKVNLPSLPSPGPTISCFDDFDFFKDFDNEFPAIVYNNAQTSKSDLLTGSILSPQHIVEFDLNDKTSLFEYDEDEQNVCEEVQCNSRYSGKMCVLCVKRCSKRKKQSESHRNLSTQQLFLPAKCITASYFILLSRSRQSLRPEEERGLEWFTSTT